MTFKFSTVIAVAALQFASQVAAQEQNGVTPTEIVIGTITDLSGPAVQHGVANINAQRMRIEEINAKGGIHGRKLRLVVEDSQYQVPRAVQAANKLINRDKVFLMVNNLGTPMNNAILPEQLKANIPNMFPASQARQMSYPFHRLKFVNAATNYDSARGAANWFIGTKGKKNICVMYVDSDFGKEFLEGTSDEVKKHGLQVSEQVSYRPTDTDFGAQIIRLKNANCDLVVLGSLVRDSILAYTTARNAGWTNVDFVTVAGYDPALAQAPGGATEGLYVAPATIVPDRETASPAAAKWIDAYKARFGIDPNISAINGWNFIDLIAIGLERAGKDLTVDKFIAGMETIKDYRDMFGGTVQNYSPTQHQGTRSVSLLQVRGGKFVKLAGPLTY